MNSEVSAPGFDHEFYKNRREILGEENNKIVLLFDSPGGDADAAYLLVEILKRYCNHIEIVVPLWAKSAATLVCLAAQKIYMTGVAELGPLDPQVIEPGETRLKGALDEYKAIMQLREEAFSNLDSAVRLIMNRSGGMSVQDILVPAGDFVARLLEPLYYQINPEILGRRARQLDVGFQYAIRILLRNEHYNKELISDLADKLVYGYPSHSFVINYYEAILLGLPVQLMEPGVFIEELITFLMERKEELCVIGSFLGEETSLCVDGELKKFPDLNVAKGFLQDQEEQEKEGNINVEGEPENLSDSNIV